MRNNSIFTVVYKQLTTQDFEEMIERTHLALKDFYKGNPEPYNQLYSSAKDISLLGAQGGIAVGGEEVAQHLTSRASWFRAGGNVSFEKLVKLSTQDLGYTVEIERFDAKVAGTNEIVHIALRVTTIFRREGGEWKVIHRQGDPLVSRIDPATYISLAKHNIEAKQ
jgi:ketosteroid isomerase-like protein